MASETLLGGRRSAGREQAVAGWRSAKAATRGLDIALLAAALALAAFGCLEIYSSTRPGLEARGLDQYFFLKRQLAFLTLAAIAFLLTMLYDYRQLRNVASIFHGGVLLLLVVVLTPAGHTTAGAQRWINLGFLQVQPSEFMKVALIISLSALFAKSEARDGDLREMIIAVGRTAVPAALIFLQPDMGTMMVLSAILTCILLVARVKVRWLALLALVAILGFALVLNLGLLRDYQVARLTGFLDPNSDTTRAGYNLAQSKIAIGSGGLLGKGLFRGTQTNLDFVPEQHTDFIFTAIGEEMGFVGAMALLGLFSFVVWRGLRIAMLAKDTFGALLAAGVTGMVAFQVFVNVGMTVGIMPITGIPLPLVSYGGSSLIASFAAVGLLMNVHMRRFN